MKRYISIVTAALVIGAALPVGAQQTTEASPPPAIRLYTLDCGLTEFKNADVFSDTGEYANKYLALPTPVT